MSADLFGLMDLPPMTAAERRRKVAQARNRAKGYAALPGTGPEGERCKTCKHLAIRWMARTYFKCGLMRGVWSGTRSTDVLVNSPACRRWEPDDRRRGD